MLSSTGYRELRNGKRYQRSIECTMSDHGSTEENATGISSENVEGEGPEIQTLTQEAVNEQIRGFIAPLTRPLEELTRLVQGMTTTPHPNHYRRIEFGTTSGTAITQSDTEIRGLSLIIAIINKPDVAQAVTVCKPQNVPRGAHFCLCDVFSVSKC